MSCAHYCLSCRLDRIEELLVAVLSKADNERARENAHYKQILERLTTMATRQEDMQAALDALNASTSQESALLAANNAKLDAVQALITELVNTAGIPQALIDQANAIRTTLSGVIDSSTAQAARLDQLAVDPRNPVPSPTPSP
jgi:hypothetical protein